jgi:hypothetical protein
MSCIRCRARYTEHIRTNAKPSSVHTLLKFRVSFYIAEGNEKVSACHSENQIYSGSTNLKLQYYLQGGAHIDDEAPH